jgi:hypothetical protein
LGTLGVIDFGLVAIAGRCMRLLSAAALAGSWLPGPVSGVKSGFALVRSFGFVDGFGFSRRVLVLFRQPASVDGLQLVRMGGWREAFGT